MIIELIHNFLELNSFHPIYYATFVELHQIFASPLLLNCDFLFHNDEHYPNIFYLFFLIPLPIYRVLLPTSKHIFFMPIQHHINQISLFKYYLNKHLMPISLWICYNWIFWSLYHWYFILEILLLFFKIYSQNVFHFIIMFTQ